MVKFLMPDGTEVSNDPRFDLEKAREEMLASKPNTGDIGTPDDEQKAQTLVEKRASLNSAQPGVGDNPAPEDPVRDAHGPLGSPAQQRQKDDAKQAREEGGSPDSTTVDDDEPVDSNEKVLEARAARQKRMEKAQKAEGKLGEDGPGDPEQPYSEWSPAQLKAEAFRRNAERDDDNQLDLDGVSTKAQLAEVLERDDENQSA
jgi:hypothetical protein